MLGRKTKSKSSGTNPFLRFIRGVFSVVVLTALVLGITLGAKELYAVDSARFGKISSSLLAKMHINVDEEQIGEVAGKFAERISQTNLGSGVSSSRLDSEVDKNVYAGKDAVAEIAIISDIHDDAENLTVALEKIQERGIEDVFILGDITGYGDVPSLTKIKGILEGSGVEYFALPGDHDMAQSSDTDNFTSVFGNEYGETDIAGYNFVYFNNAANYTIIEPGAISWIETQLPDADFFLVSQPLHTEELAPPFNRIFMGSTNGEVTDLTLADKQDAVKSQGEMLLSLVRDTVGVKALIAGDHHKSSSLVDPKRPSLMHYTVGAITSSLNEYPQKALQSSRFSVLSIYQDGSYEVSDIVLD
ncbi:hypothetical protein A2380_02280 [candidate division WWE3 bacterium RIFOXYB1_FULL_43_24]|uniref:Metallophosphoesterase n=1 Tax=candidate division WWE3 bacterium GW2011_GWF1_42_14 TaxID=1619138 RepID=A0A0G1BI85_UNCKA|nr:MAG: Metallophosphoesterase [candidate division WWE3 bacterium GW2011_GWF1_42_14]KKS39728.1 MAG: Metallophosphoesterase [candidate division WWE3 bacterium GW2011_GWE1_42_16]OGC59972.1 MAG: hypothetical protein A2212_01285 [candidate division WWE3 bacterium RIFOXYA1_FULL_42_9]OGC68763.1 MAG: hypothetical protein A2380_02280 [candidate division WWE3 bacterium RIFOXYB1_FULL_43_24]OGC72042.1 MAG: hypothetical protein A2414_03740 [candidate division WWE3 bacterium RIFOXYC1_FULL_42_13]